MIKKKKIKNDAIVPSENFLFLPANISLFITTDKNWYCIKTKSYKYIFTNSSIIFDVKKKANVTRVYFPDLTSEKYSSFAR